MLADGESPSTRWVEAPVIALAFLSLADGESPSSYGLKTPSTRALSLADK